MVPLTVQRRSISHKEYKLHNEGGDAQSHRVRCPGFSFAFSISHLSADIFPLYRPFRESAARLMDAITEVILRKKKILYHQTSNYQPLRRYEHFSVMCRFLWPSFKHTPTSGEHQYLSPPIFMYGICKYNIRRSVNSVYVARRHEKKQNALICNILAVGLVVSF